MEVRHPARTMPFHVLYVGLEAAVTAGNVTRKDDPDTGRALYVYSDRCVYENAWDEFSLLARGLVLHPATEAVVATPFAKFFNAGERGRAIPNGSFDTLEKMDGSLVIIHHFDGDWRCATKGSFASSQTEWVEAWLDRNDTSSLVPGTTYLCEAVYPENRIVVRYDWTGLCLLGAYREDGTELRVSELRDVAYWMEGWTTPETQYYEDFTQLVADARALPGNREGFVIRFEEDGTRLKVKGAEYCRIHASISRCTPLAIWEAMAAGDDLEAMRRDLPEEFLPDFDGIRAALDAQVSSIVDRVRRAVADVAGMTDKELGQSLDRVPADVRHLICPVRENGGLDFPIRASDGGVPRRTMGVIHRMVRPTGNLLPGHAVSSLLERATGGAA